MVGVSQGTAAEGKEVATNGAQMSNGGGAEAMEVDDDAKKSGRRLHVGHSALGFRRADMEVLPGARHDEDGCSLCSSRLALCNGNMTWR